MRTIRVVNQSTVVPDAEFAAAVAACDKQIAEHFAPAWGGLTAALMDAKACAGAPEQPTAETVYILDDSDQAGALGYHELDAGVPVAFVFARTTAQDGGDWRVTLSHELLEQIADPYCTACAIVPFGSLPVAAVEYEVCDPVEQDSYKIDGVPVSNFVLPAWFQPGEEGPFDCLGRLSAPLTLTSGGFVGYTADLKNWQQVFASDAVRERRGRTPEKYRRSGKRSYQR